ncbi:response regulator [Rhodophyticola sp. CCM32]|uniref:PP2C family protein-serine/threonine phosphatase n=1 Tax=Rhodophyticola sp. CCM32 TaxID=2916397 RepID=UPI00107EF8EC|nr:SpoIIE family protein phosphatase [Rhodophyticola sp. CCM32]QBY01234.1 response regulator [Rhodophyticola sp. CCM32]
MKVIIADDDDLQRAILSAALTRIGHSPIEASDGAQAFDLLCEHNASILVCDLNMPGMDGNALTQKVRATIRDRYVHIIMVTGHDQKSVRHHALQLGVDEFMGKPIEAATLNARISTTERLVQHEELIQEKNRILEEAQRIIEQDLKAAAQAQQRLLPAPRINGPHCSFFSAFVPSSYVSGDMFATFQLPDGRTGFYAMDVSGHGVSAALLSVAIGHLVTTEYFARHSIDDDGTPDPARLAKTLNDRFFHDDSEDYFTFFCAILDHETQMLHFCQAGYPSPMVVSPGGTIHEIGDGGYPVALLPDVDFISSRVALAVDETLVLFSDGATEAEDAHSVAFGQERLSQVIEAARARDVTSIPDAIVSALRAWRGQRSLDDDLTVLVCQRRLPE